MKNKLIIEAGLNQIWDALVADTKHATYKTRNEEALRIIKYLALSDRFKRDRPIKRDDYSDIMIRKTR